MNFLLGIAEGYCFINVIDSIAGKNENIILRGEPLRIILLFLYWQFRSNNMDCFYPGVCSSGQIIGTASISDVCNSGYIIQTILICIMPDIRINRQNDKQRDLDNISPDHHIGKPYG